MYRKHGCIPEACKCEAFEEKSHTDQWKYSMMLDSWICECGHSLNLHFEREWRNLEGVETPVGVKGSHGPQCPIGGTTTHTFTCYQQLSQTEKCVCMTHESDGITYLSNPEQYRCKRCGEYYYSHDLIVCPVPGLRPLSSSNNQIGSESDREKNLRYLEERIQIQMMGLR